MGGVSSSGPPSLLTQMFWICPPKMSIEMFLREEILKWAELRLGTLSHRSAWVLRACWSKKSFKKFPLSQVLSERNFQSFKKIKRGRSFNSKPHHIARHECYKHADEKWASKISNVGSSEWSTKQHFPQKKCWFMSRKFKLKKKI